GLKAAQVRRVVEPSGLNQLAQPRLFTAGSKNEQPRIGPLSQDGEGVEEERIVLGFGQASGGHDHRRLPVRGERLVDRSLRRRGHCSSRDDVSALSSRIDGDTSATNGPLRANRYIDRSQRSPSSAFSSCTATRSAPPPASEGITKQTFARTASRCEAFATPC